jgi:hypothetical protein
MLSMLNAIAAIGRDLRANYIEVNIFLWGTSLRYFVHAVINILGLFSTLPVRAKLNNTRRILPLAF